jgi:hypothetical protein
MKVITTKRQMNINATRPVADGPKRRKVRAHNVPVNNSMKK